MFRFAGLVICLVLTSMPGAALAGKPKSVRVVADVRVEEPVRAIVSEYTRRTGVPVHLELLKADELQSQIAARQASCDVAIAMAESADGDMPISRVDGAKKVAWSHPGGEPVWAAAVGEHPQATELVEFLGGLTGHQLWSSSEAGFTIVSGRSHAEAFDWVVENRLKHTYPMTAMRILGELGGIRKGVCIDIGCGTGNLDVELAKRSEFKILGLDIDADMQSLFAKRISEAGFQDRASFVEGDAQALPFPDDYADVIVSRGTLTFIPDIAKCLQEVDRVLKPSGVAFLGGRYLYTPQMYKKSTEELREIVRRSGVAGAKVVEERGQWVKIVGPAAPEAARGSGIGPQMLAGRLVADYGITEGRCLLVCGSDGALQQTLQKGLVQSTDLEIVAMYPSKKLADEAAARIRRQELDRRIVCQVGRLDALPFGDGSIDLLVGVGPVLIWGDRQKKIVEIYRVLRPGGAALVGGRYLGMPESRKVSSEVLRADVDATGIPGIRVFEDRGQWVEVLQGPGR